MKSQQFDIDSEKLVLGAILLEPECIEKAACMVSAEDFSSPHALIFNRALELFQSGLAIDSGLVINSLKSHNELNDAGGHLYVLGLTRDMPKGSNIASYASLVRKSADARKAREAIKLAVYNTGNNGSDPSESIDELIVNLQKIRQFDPLKASHKFEKLAEDRFILSLPEMGISLEADRLRRDHNELIGELCVKCRLPGSHSYDGTLSIADFNLSSARARSERSRLLADRGNCKDLDWMGYLEELCQRVLAAERSGSPAVDLRDMERPNPDDAIRIEGLTLPRRHPSILFGDGGAAKSYLALYLAGLLSQGGMATAIFDWELAGEDHRDRLERIFGKMMPKVSYARCERPLIYEADRLKRIVRDEKIEYAFFDSIAFACDGPPESAEIAGRYFRGLRQIGIGSFHVAHVTKMDGADQKPFGSVFWHNGARSTYYAKLSDTSSDGKTLQVGLFHRKANLGRIHPPVGLEIKFEGDRTFFTKSEPAQTPEIAEKMTTKDRMRSLLKLGEMDIEELAKLIDAKPDTVRKTAQRLDRLFVCLPGGKVALALGNA
jgi:hypothetical protein